MTRKLINKTKKLAHSAAEMRNANLIDADRKDQAQRKQPPKVNQPRKSKKDLTAALKQAAAKRAEEALRTAIQVEAIVNELNKEVERYRALDKELLFNRHRLQGVQSSIFLAKNELNILLQALPDYLERFAEPRAIPAKNGFQGIYERAYELSVSTLPKKIEPSMMDRHNSLGFYKNIAYQFLSSHLSSGKHLNELQSHLDILFKGETNSEDAKSSYSKFFSTIRRGGEGIFVKDQLSVQAQEQITNYLEILYRCNLFAWKADETLFFPGTILSSLQGLFKQQIKKGLYPESDKKSIKRLFDNEFEIYQQQTEEKSLHSTRSSRNQSDIPDLLAQLSEQRNKFAAEMQTGQESRRARDKIHEVTTDLLTKREIQKNPVGLKDYLGKVANACLKIDELEADQKELNGKLNKLTKQQQRYEKLNQVVKYQILASLTEYSKAMQNKTLAEKMAHTTEGENRAREFALSIRDTDYPNTLRLLVNFLHSANSLRNHSFATCLLKTIHAQLYGFMELLKKLSNPIHVEEAENHVDRQLDKYQECLDLSAAFFLAGPTGITQQYPSESTMVSSHVVTQALDKNLSGWGTLFHRSTKEREFLREKTVNALKFAGAIATTGAPIVAAAFAGHHGPEALGLAGAGGYAFWAGVKTAVSRILTPNTEQGNKATATDTQTQYTSLL